MNLHHLPFFITLFMLQPVFAQDSIILKSGTRKQVQLLETNAESVHFKPSAQSPNSFYFAKADVAEIYYSNGVREKVISPSFTIAQLHDKITGIINEFAFHEQSKRKLSATVDSDLLRITEQGSNKTLLIDPAKVYQFQPISNRSATLSFTHIVLETQESQDEQWRKFKWVAQFEQPEKATLLVAYFKLLNKQLEEKNGDFIPVKKK